MNAVREIIVVVCATVAPLVSAAEAGAQSRIELTPAVGAFFPTTPLGSIQSPSQIADVPATFHTARLKPGVALAVMGALRRTGSAQRYWLELGYVPSVGLTFDDRSSAFSASVRSIALGIGRDLSAGDVRAQARLGAGLRSYGITPHVSDGPLLPSSSADAEGVAALGISWAISSIAVELEASDYLGTVPLERRNAASERRIQNRVFVRLGIRL